MSKHDDWLDPDRHMHFVESEEDGAPSTVWHVLWDNGTDACGEFHWDFATADAADKFGQDWLAEFRVNNDVDEDDDSPGYDVIEVRRKP